MPNGKFYRYAYGVILVLLILYLSTKVSFLLNPVLKVIQTLFLPFILAGVFYYLLRPFVNFLAKRKVNRTLGILLIFLILLGILAFIILEIVPIVRTQLNNLIQNMPQIVVLVNNQVNHLLENDWIAELVKQNQVDLSAKLTEYANRIISGTGDAFNTILSFISGFVILLSTVPFILYYLLKEGEKVPGFILKLLPAKHHEEGRNILSEMDDALSAYIQGKIMVSMILGLLIYVGYLIIGLDYSLILAVAAAVMNVIPFVGLFIGIIPSIVVAFIHSPGMLIQMLIVVIVVQQIESNFLSPQVMGKKLDIHPLTIILLLIMVGSISGLLGMFLAIPVYAILKVIVTHVYRMYGLRRQE